MSQFLDDERVEELNLVHQHAGDVGQVDGGEVARESMQLYLLYNKEDNIECAR